MRLDLQHPLRLKAKLDFRSPTMARVFMAVVYGSAPSVVRRQSPRDVRTRQSSWRNRRAGRMPTNCGNMSIKRTSTTTKGHSEHQARVNNRNHLQANKPRNRPQNTEPIRLEQLLGLDTSCVFPVFLPATHQQPLTQVVPHSIQPSPQ